METKAKTKITINAAVNVPVAKAWELWNKPEAIIVWNTAHPEWHTPKATNDLRVGGKFSSRMEAKDGSMGFDFEGTYTEVKPNELIAYTMADGRTARVVFESKGSSTNMTITFDAEDQNPVEMQRGGWQAILDNFKAYAESQS